MRFGERSLFCVDPKVLKAVLNAERAALRKIHSMTVVQLMRLKAEEGLLLYMLEQTQNRASTETEDDDEDDEHSDILLSQQESPLNRQRLCGTSSGDCSDPDENRDIRDKADEENEAESPKLPSTRGLKRKPSGSFLERPQGWKEKCPRPISLQPPSTLNQPIPVVDSPLCVAATKSIRGRGSPPGPQRGCFRQESEDQQEVKSFHSKPAQTQSALSDIEGEESNCRTEDGRDVSRSEDGSKHHLFDAGYLLQHSQTALEQLDEDDKVLEEVQGLLLGMKELVKDQK